jgi:hypothetical protein
MDLAFVDMNGRVEAGFFKRFFRASQSVYCFSFFRFKSRNNAALSYPTSKTGESDFKGAEKHGKFLHKSDMY